MSIRAVKPHLSAPLLAGSLLQDQIATETQAVEAGVRRYHELARDSIARGEGASIKPAERLCLYWFQPVKDLLYDEIWDCVSNVPGLNRSIIGPLIRQLSAEDLAVIVMHEALGACMAAEDENGVPLSKLAYSVGRAAIAHIHLAKGKEGHRDSLKALEFSTRSLTVGKVNWWANRTLEDPATDRRATTMLGSTMLVCLMDGASCKGYDPEDFEPAFEQVTLMQQRRAALYFRMTDRTWEIIDEGHTIRERLRPRYLPMIVEPFPWQEKTSDRPRTEGGYVKIRTPLVSKPTQSQKAAYEAADLTDTFDCLNAVCATPLAIHGRIMAEQKHVWETGGGELGIPRRDNEPKPPRPEGFDDFTPEQKKPWKKLAVETHRRNIANRGARVGYLSALSVADEFAPQEAIYYPHQLDFRGRAYPIPAHLNHQGDDARVSLLRFSNSVEPDMRWLLIHAANCYGKNKLSLDDRYQWGRDHLKDIVQCAMDPRGEDWWHHADESRPGAKDGKPWQFLAACMAVENPECGSRQPVSIDGTCNGLQHYTALTGDPETAAMVNMLPSRASDPPASAYHRIVDEVTSSVKKDIQDDGGRTMTFDTEAGAKVLTIREVATLTLPYVAKNTCKQPFMTRFYNVTPTGARKQIQGVLKEMGVPKEHRYPIARYMADAILKGVSTVCAGADAAMEWLRTCAGLIVGKKRPVTWKTPLGFPVVQPYRLMSKIRVDTLLGNLTLRVDDDKMPVSVRRQVDGCPPNVIHCFDAAHMFRTARACHRERIDFLGTHDRYFSHAAHMDRLREIAPAEFVRLHGVGLLDNLWGQWSTLHPDIDFPEPPPLGTYDLDDVLHSAYFFS